MNTPLALLADIDGELTDKLIRLNQTKTILTTRLDRVNQVISDLDWFRTKARQIGRYRSELPFIEGERERLIELLEPELWGETVEIPDYLIKMAIQLCDTILAESKVAS